MLLARVGDEKERLPHSELTARRWGRSTYRGASQTEKTSQFAPNEGRITAFAKDGLHNNRRVRDQLDMTRNRRSENELHTNASGSCLETSHMVAHLRTRPNVVSNDLRATGG